MANKRSKSIAGMADGLILPKKPKPAKSVELVEPPPPFESTKHASTKRRAEPGERLAVYVPPELVTRLRVHCAQTRSSLSDAITRFVETGLSALPKDPSKP